MVGTGYTPTVGTGPISDFSKKGNYLVAEGDYGVSPTSATLVSKCLDLSGLTHPVLQFRHHMYGLDANFIRVQWIATEKTNGLIQCRHIPQPLQMKKILGASSS